VIFIDTGAYIARHLPADQHRDRSLAAWEDLGRSGWRCFTSNLVLSETLTLLARRTSYPFAVERAFLIMTSSGLTILRPDREVELEALEIFQKLADQRVSFTDCVSFALMRRNRIQRAFTFDRHFRAAGFEIWPAGGA